METWQHAWQEICQLKPNKTLGTTYNIPGDWLQMITQFFPRGWETSCQNCTKRSSGYWEAGWLLELCNARSRLACWLLGLHNAQFQIARVVNPVIALCNFLGQQSLPLKMWQCKTEDSHWVEISIFWEERRALPLRIVQCCLGEAESGPRLPKPANGQLKADVNVNAWKY